MIDAIRQLDAEGGWDHETTGGWPDLPTYRALRRAEEVGLVERGVSFDIMNWRLTDEGIQFRSGLEGSDAALAALETETDPLPDAVAAAWDVELDPPVQIPADKLLRMVRRLLEFPYPQICRHSVACDLLSLLEEHGYPVTDALAAAVVRADDGKALELLHA
jgi:hypothetical protein